MEGINFREFFTYLKRYIPLLILTPVIAVLGAYFYDTKIKTPLYKATTSVILVQANDQTASSNLTLNDVNMSQKLTTTYSQIAKSELVLQRVIDELDLDKTVSQLSSSISVTSVSDTSILTISVQDPDQDQSARIANQIADVFSEEVAQIYNLDNVSTLDVAKTPTSPSNDTLRRDLIISGALGLLLILAIAFIAFYLNDAIHYNDDFETVMKIPVAGKVYKGDVKSDSRKRNKRRSPPQTGEKAELISRELVVEELPKSSTSESIKNLRTNLQFTSVDKDLKTILVTSTNASEGKSFISSNLAISFVQTGKRVLLVDCDLRKGRLHEVFHVPNVNGLSTLLTDEIINLQKYVQDTNIKNLKIITRGAYPPNPSELLSSQKNRHLVQRLKRDFDIIIFDGTPCNAIADSIVMSTLVDEVLIVATDAKTSRSALMATKEALDKVGAHLAGLVINQVDKKVARYYNYYGYYGDEG